MLLKTIHRWRWQPRNKRKIFPFQKKIHYFHKQQNLKPATTQNKHTPTKPIKQFRTSADDGARLMTVDWSLESGPRFSFIYQPFFYYFQLFSGPIFPHSSRGVMYANGRRDISHRARLINSGFVGNECDRTNIAALRKGSICFVGVFA